MVSIRKRRPTPGVPERRPEGQAGLRMLDTTMSRYYGADAKEHGKAALVRLDPRTCELSPQNDGSYNHDGRLNHVDRPHRRHADGSRSLKNKYPHETALADRRTGTEWIVSQGPRDSLPRVVRSGPPQISRVYSLLNVRFFSDVAHPKSGQAWLLSLWPIPFRQRSAHEDGSLDLPSLEAFRLNSRFAMRSRATSRL
jgi:hypothetical protein